MGGSDNRTVVSFLVQNLREVKFFYLDEVTPDTKPSDYYTLDPSLCPLISDNINEKIRNGQDYKMYEKKPIKLHINKITQRIFLVFLIKTFYLSFLVQIFVMSLDAK